MIFINYLKINYESLEDYETLKNYFFYLRAIVGLQDEIFMKLFK